ncbi:MAG: hypothetical protein FJ272_08425, partial [Planctomycetes bacterium]|nr:hypothetical protein [Planctomycetota bacterium]
MPQAGFAATGWAILAIGALCGTSATLFLVQAQRLTPEWGFPLDDSWIHLRFAANLADGHGFAFNKGEPTPGSTAPLWTLLLALVLKITGGVCFPVYAAGVAFHVATCVMAFKLSELVGAARNRATWVAVFTAASATFTWSSLSGLEVTFFTFLSLAGIYCHIRHGGAGSVRTLIAPALFGLAALARPEGVALFAFALFDDLLRFRRRAGTSLVTVCRRFGGKIAVFGLIVAPWVVFCLQTTGRPLPNTFYAKTAGEAQLLSLHHFKIVLRLLILDHPGLVILWPFGVASLVMSEFSQKARRPRLLPLYWAFGLPLAYTLMPYNQFTMTGGNLGRYFYPVLPLFVLFGVHGAFFLFDSLATRYLGLNARWALLLRRIALVTCVVLSLAHEAEWSALYAWNVKNVNEMDVAMGRWLAANTPPEAVVAANDIGAIAFFSDRKIIDTVGIITPGIIPYLRRYGQFREDFQESGVRRYLEEHRPSHVAVFPDWYPKLT